MAVQSRIHSTGRTAAKTVLSIGGTPAATVARYVGGEPYAVVVNEPGGLLPYAKKHIGALQFADVAAEVAMDADAVLFDWIRDAWFGNPFRDNVSLERLDPASSLQTVEIAHAAIREVTLPALDQNARDRCAMSLKLVPSGIRRTGAVSAGLHREERDFLSHNFKVDIGGIDCSGVLAVDSFTVKTSLPEPGSRKRPTLIFPDVRLYVDADKADSFREWFEDFVIAGNNDDEREREGYIEYQDPMLGDPLAVLHLRHMGIYRVADEPSPRAGLRRVQVDLYCERMELSSSGASPATTGSLSVR
jgi:hypothetical protein